MTLEGAIVNDDQTPDHSTHDAKHLADPGRRDFVVDAAALASLMALPGLASAQGTPVRGGNLNIGYPADPRIYNGFVFENSPQYAVMHHVVSKLLWWDAKNNLTGDLAEKWSQSADNREITFNLRRNVKWHDGKPFTADDVVWSLQTVQKLPLSFGRFLAKMTEVRALDSHTVKVTFSSPTPASLFAYYVGSNVILPKHIYDGTDLKANTANPIGTGPFKWKQYARDQSVVLERNPDYYGTVPYLDTITFKFTPNPATAILQLRSGALDVISNFRNLGVNDLLTLSKDPKYQVAFVNSTVVMRAAFNFRPEAIAKHKWLSDIRCRQAVTHAIDRETICNKLLHGYVTPSWGPMARGNPMYDPNIKAPAYDPARANALLDEAGYKRGPDGVRFTTELAYIPYFGTDAAAPAIADMLGRVGIKVNLLTGDYGAFLTKYWLGPNGQGDTPMSLIIGIHAPTADDSRPNYDSRYQPRNNGNGVNIPEVDKLFDDGLAEPNPTKQRAIYWRLQQALSDAVANVWIGTYRASNVATRKVRNLSSTGSWEVLQRFNEVWIAKS